jgi:hypothetical protein
MKHIKCFESFTNENYVGAESAKDYKNRQRKLLAAQEMEKRGIDYDTIRWRTGWFKGDFDDKWRYELNSAALKLKPVKISQKTLRSYNYDNDGRFHFVLKLGDLIANTTLLKDSPNLKDHIVLLCNYRDPDDFNAGGYHYASHKEIHIFKVKMNGKACQRYLELIQPMYKADREVFDHARSKYSKEYIAAKAKYDAIINEMQELEAIPNVVDTDDNRLKSVLLHEIQHAIQDQYNFPRGANPVSFQDKIKETPDGEVSLSPMDQYMLAAGEIEARDVQNRMHLPKKGKFFVDIYIWDKDRYDEEDNYITSEKPAKPTHSIAFDTWEDANHFEVNLPAKYRGGRGKQYETDLRTDRQSKYMQSPYSNKYSLYKHGQIGDADVHIDMEDKKDKE